MVPNKATRMAPEQLEVLNLNLLPARLNVAQTATLLGYHAHDIPILVANKFLKPLGHPRPSGVKYFAATVIEQLRRDERWLSCSTDCLYRYWRGRKDRSSSSIDNDAA